MEDISVIITYYNESKTLPATLELVAAQTLQPREVLFINSSSTDNSHDIIEEWIKNNASKYSVRFRNLNEGTNVPGSSKNAGVRNAVGEFLAFMDCGLLFEKDWLEKQMNYLRGRRLDVASGLCRFKGETLIDKSAIAQTYGYLRCRPTIPSTVVRKSVFEKIGFFMEYRRAGYDVDWANKLKTHHVVRGINEEVIIQYNGINFASSFKQIFLKLIMYSEPNIGVHHYFYPYFYVAGLLFLLVVFVFVPFAVFPVFLLYFFFRGYAVPVYKSRSARLLYENPLFWLVLPAAGFVMDAGKLVGYVKGMVKYFLRRGKNKLA